MKLVLPVLLKILRGTDTMDRAEALRAIHQDHLEYIQCKVQVDFDNSRQEPVNFRFAGRSYAVNQVVCSFKMIADQPANGYLVEAADKNVFCLYSQLEKVERRDFMERGFWVLCFRIQNDDELMSWYLEERKMLTNVSLKRVVDFHGHICPELALGGKFCEFVQGLFNDGVLPTSGFSIISENATSALDAIQVMLGATVGNQRLMVMDFGKHTYTLFSRPESRGWRLKQKPLCYGDEDIFSSLEQKISSNQALFEDAIHFQQLIDARVRQILALLPEELFTIEEVDAGNRPPESASVYLTCGACGEQVLASRSIESRNMTLCMPCFQKMSPGCTHYSIQ
jgi:formylmethanofuran dehydrogenase subunit E